MQTPYCRPCVSLMLSLPNAPHQRVFYTCEKYGLKLVRDTIGNPLRCMACRAEDGRGVPQKPEPRLLTTVHVDPDADGTELLIPQICKTVLDYEETP